MHKKILWFFILTIGIFFIALAVGYIRTPITQKITTIILPPEIINVETIKSQETEDAKPNTKKQPTVTVFSEKLGPVRLMTFSPDNVLIASITKQGRVVALPDKNNDDKADRVVDVIKNLQLPHGLAFHKNNLYIAETNQVIRLNNFKNDFTYDSVDTILTGIPGGQNHFSRTLVIKDDKMYVSVGSSCNVCHEKDAWRAAVIQANLDGSNPKIFASGLRNSVGIDFHPKTNELWGSDNGRDLLGADLPPEEINIIKEDANYGWPICYGQKNHDTSFDINIYKRNPCEDTVAPIYEMQAHTAPLGIRFYSGDMFPEYNNNLFIALHGSWNRVIPVGYQVMRMEITESEITKEHKFIDLSSLPVKIDRFRPVDINFDTQGKIYISDDHNGIIFLVTKK